LLRAVGGWVAVTLARAEDWAALPAWLGTDATTWEDVTRRLAGMPIAEACGGGALLEIPVSAVPDAPTCPGPAPWAMTPVATGSRPPPRRPLVVDLSALWAGPLCADLLRRTGARVVKVEDPRRPDGARRGVPAIFDVLNAGKLSVAVDIRGPELRRLVAVADVVISSARPRAIEQLGIDVWEVLAASPTVWVAITAHGWSGPDRNRVGFGDDAAAAAGLVARHPVDGEPRFVADAAADPLCGALSAVAALTALSGGGSWLVDAPLVSAAAYAAGLAPGGLATCALPGSEGQWLAEDGAGPPEPVLGPRARAAHGRAASLGADTDAVLAELGLTDP
jgi:crotonobetainyl-CoA:carnitine CoA-transferase CaiB-like acyl-CoA transferase